MYRKPINAALLLVALAAAIGCAETAPKPNDPAAANRSFSPGAPGWSEQDEDLRARFAEEHQAAGTADRPVFARYLSQLGPVALLDYLEETYPGCHGQAHSLGKELYKQSQDLMVSLQICGTRCTGACMHGVVGEALGEGGAMHQDIRGRMEGFCSSEAMAAHKRGNCAHAIGHALLLNSHDLSFALKGCNEYEVPAMRYYCATGVYMQYRDWLNEGVLPQDRPTTLFPCDQQSLFPAACYRYMMPFIRDANDLIGLDIIELCKELPGYERRGCFHGFGFAYLTAVMDRLTDQPDVLEELCVHGTPADQAMCVEGVVEKMVDFDAALAKQACAPLHGDLSAVCYAAATGGMYRLEKPTLEYYLPSASTQ